jgi:hypothetical protein
MRRSFASFPGKDKAVSDANRNVLGDKTVDRIDQIEDVTLLEAPKDAVELDDYLDARSDVGRHIGVRTSDSDVEGDFGNALQTVMLLGPIAIELLIGVIGELGHMASPPLFRRSV